MVAHALSRDRDDEPQFDNIVVLRDVTWADYQRMLEVRGDRSAPRITYLEGRLEIMSPSKPHESIKSNIGCLVDVFCTERRIGFQKLGSWTLEQKALERGIEPDECYYFGHEADPTRPDLAIEVVWTSGGVNKLDVYRMLAVREVWFWRRGALTPHVLVGDEHEARTKSEVLPELDLTLLASFLDRPTTSEAIYAYQDALRK